MYFWGIASKTIRKLFKNEQGKYVFGQFKTKPLKPLLVKSFSVCTLEKRQEKRRRGLKRGCILLLFQSKSALRVVSCTPLKTDLMGSGKISLLYVPHRGCSFSAQSECARMIQGPATPSPLTGIPGCYWSDWAASRIKGQEGWNVASHLLHPNDSHIGAHGACG